MPLVAEISAAPVIVLMALGVVVAIAGHATRTRALVALGLVVLFTATAIMIVGGAITYDSSPRDPRPAAPVGGGF